jgi:hypothetical protein
VGFIEKQILIDSDNLPLDFQKNWTNFKNHKCVLKLSKCVKCCRSRIKPQPEDFKIFCDGNFLSQSDRANSESHNVDIKACNCSFVEVRYELSEG